jgi:Ca-activated chloride channel family protein
MSENELHADDPRLTAYALGELDPTEREAVERLLSDSPAAQATVREVRDLAGLLTAELKQEPAPTLTAAQRTAILEGKAAKASPVAAIRRRASSRWIGQFAALASMAALVAVAAFLPAPGNRPDDRMSSANSSRNDLHDIRGDGGEWSLALRQQAQRTEFDLIEINGNAEGIGTEVTALSAGSALSAGRSSGGFGGTESLGTIRDGISNGIGSGEKGYISEGSRSGKGSLSRGHSMEAKLAADKNARANAARNEPAQPVREAEVAMKRNSGQDERYDRAPALDETKPRNAKSSSKSHSRPDGEPAAPRAMFADGSVRFTTSGTTVPNPTAPAKEAVGGPGSGTQSAGMSGGGSGGGRAIAGLAETDNRPASELKQHRAFFGESAERKDGGKKGDAHYLYFMEAGDSERREGFRRPWHEGAPGTEVYEPIVENPFLSSYEDPLSTFGIDVDTASYSNVRRFLTQQQLPPPNAVRIEELVNYFSYDYPQPAGDQPFSVNVEAGRCPWNPTNGLVRIGLKGREIERDKRPASNLVFLVDVSGSMQAENKLPLVKMGLHLLTQQMTESDKVAIVTYSDTAVERLESTNGTNKQAIQGVIESLRAGGSTNGAQGIQIAYGAAVRNFVPGGTNRVILCTDGDFNVGVTGDDELVKLIQDKVRTKVFFSVLGFGMENLKDGKLEKLADKGNGQYAYIDSQNEARKVFVDDLVGTLVTIAKDVKIQVEFNPNQVGAYRLIGYENRVMAAQDFNNDAKDAGDIGAGHTVTALYETIPTGEAPKPLLGDTLRYRNVVVPKEGGLANELLTVKLRYKLPEADTSTLVEVPVNDPKAPVAGVGGQANAPSPPRMSRDFNWSAAVAAFGMILRDSQFRGQANFDMVLELAQGALGEDKGGRRREFIDLVKSAKALYGPPAAAAEPTTRSVPAREDTEAKASVSGKYENLLRIVAAPGDAASYGAFHDYGHWDGTSYAGQDNLPKGYWVYVAPNWYIWGDEAPRRP